MKSDLFIHIYLLNATVNKHAKYHVINFDEAVYYQYQMLIL